MKLKDRVALITGGSSGIGRAAAVAMAREGANIALTARRAERCEEAVAEIEGLGGQALALPGDVANAEHVAGLVAATVERWGRLDIVVPNAGINGVFAPIEDITPEEWDQTHNINVRGTFLTVKYAIPHLRTAGGGSIIVDLLGQRQPHLLQLRLHLVFLLQSRPSYLRQNGRGRTGAVGHPHQRCLPRCHQNQHRREHLPSQHRQDSHSPRVPPRHDPPTTTRRQRRRGRQRHSLLGVGRG